jgi:hypothetical protein
VSWLADGGYSTICLAQLELLSALLHVGLYEALGFCKVRA